MSTTDRLKSALGVRTPAPARTTAPAPQKPTSLAGIVCSDSFKAQMKLALPKTMTADRMARIVLTECRRTPSLLKTNQESFLGAVLQCAQLGLEPGSALGHCYLLPFRTKDKTLHCQLIIGYRGMIDLARRSGQIVSLQAYTVHEKDDFSWKLGLSPDIHHVPSAEADRGKMVYVYAVAKLKDGGIQFEVMSRAEVEAIRKQSKAGTTGPWVTHFDEMAKKGLSLDTKIPTPSGWTTMEKLQKGDEVFDKDGKVTKVTAVSEIKHLPCFKVTFSNGESVICDDEHRWLARKGGANAWREPYREMTVNEMFEAQENGLAVTIPAQGALELPEADLPLDPYLFGYWLGDGTSRGAQFTCDVKDMPNLLEAIEESGFGIGTIRRNSGQSAVVGATDGLFAKLRELGVLQNKHVPQNYMRGSIEQRKALLAGLLDSDGHCDKDRGRVSFCSSNKELRDAVFELACSLGELPNRRDIMATLWEPGHRKEFPAYIVEWVPTFNPFRLERKAERFRGRIRAKYLGVKTIEQIPSVPTKCIAVDSPSRTYLCGENMAITHNTVLRRLFKYLPVSIEAARAAEVDEMTDRGESVLPDDVLEGAYVEGKTDELPEAPVEYEDVTPIEQPKAAIAAPAAPEEPPFPEN